MSYEYKWMCFGYNRRVAGVFRSRSLGSFCPFEWMLSSVKEIAVAVRKCAENIHHDGFPERAIDVRRRLGCYFLKE